MDLNLPATDVSRNVTRLLDAHTPHGLDALFMVAAQTIRGIERREALAETNRYGDSKH